MTKIKTLATCLLLVLSVNTTSTVFAGDEFDENALDYCKAFKWLPNELRPEKCRDATNPNPSQDVICQKYPELCRGGVGGR